MGVKICEVICKCFKVKILLGKVSVLINEKKIILIVDVYLNFYSISNV